MAINDIDELMATLETVDSLFKPVINKIGRLQNCCKQQINLEHYFAEKVQLNYSLFGAQCLSAVSEKSGS
jgi:hypothetical protein